MIDYLKIDKKIFGFDWFEGLKNFLNAIKN